MQHSLNYSSTSDGSPQTKRRRGRQRGRQREREEKKGKGRQAGKEKRKHGGTEVQVGGRRRGSKGELGGRMKEEKRWKSNKKKGK